MLRSLLIAPLLAAAVSAAQLAVRNARLTIDSADGSQLVSETYVVYYPLYMTLYPTNSPNKQAEH